MTDEIRERLSLSRAGMSGDLAPWEREQAQRDPVLREELELNAVLGRISRDSRIPPPPMQNVLTHARTSARIPGNRFRSATLDHWIRTIEEKLPMSPRDLVARVALAVAVLVLWPMLLNALGVIWQPCGRHTMEEAGPLYRLTYAVQVPTGQAVSLPGGGDPPVDGVPPRVTGMVRGTELVFSEMMARFSDWSERHPELKKYTTLRYDFSYEDLFAEQLENAGDVGMVCIEVEEVDGGIPANLVRELAELFEEIPEVGECIVEHVPDKAQPSSGKSKPAGPAGRGEQETAE